MSKFLKVIVNVLLLLSIISVGALVIPPFAGVTTLISDGMGNTNLSRGTVTYTKQTECANLLTGDKILVDDSQGQYVYLLRSLDPETGKAALEDIVSGAETEMTLSASAGKVLISVPVLGYLSMILQRKDGILITGLAVLFLILLFILSEVWKNYEEEKEEEDEVDGELAPKDQPDKESSAKEKKRKKKEKENREKENVPEEYDKFPESPEEIDEEIVIPSEEEKQEEGNLEDVVLSIEEPRKQEEPEIDAEDLQRMIQEEIDQQEEEQESLGDLSKPSEEGQALSVKEEEKEKQEETVKLEEPKEPEELQELEEPEPTEESEISGESEASEEPEKTAGKSEQTEEVQASEETEAEEKIPEEPVELAMPVLSAEELLEKAHAAGDDPKVIEDPETGITILDYSDII